jgi:kinesin family protein 11
MQGDLGRTPLGNPSVHAGMIPRVLFRLFHHLETNVPDYSVKVSYLEIYNEELRDLLGHELAAPVGTQQPMGKDSQKTEGLKIFDDSGKKGVFVQGLEEVGVRSSEEALAVLNKGSQRRQMAATKMNEHSSRSHAVFTLTVHTKETSTAGEDLLRVGKMNLVDLAGSESIGRSGAVDTRAREAGMINQSLLTLGRVISALEERTSHIPYRESKLTRLLQDSLGGRTKTCIIATVSPARSNMEETNSTLNYALKAKSIRNRPQVNQRMTRNSLLKEYVSEIERLKADVQAAREKNGLFISEERWKEHEEEQELARTEALEAKNQVGIIESRLRNMQEEFDQSIAVLKIKDSELKDVREKIAETEQVLEQTKGELQETEDALRDETVVRKAHEETEAALHEVATGLREVATQGLSDLDGVFSKLGTTIFYNH